MSEDASASPKKKKTPLLAKLRIAGLVLAGILVVILVAKNWEEAQIDLIVIESNMPIAVLIILTFLFGTGTGVLLAFLRPWKKNRG